MGRTRIFFSSSTPRGRYAICGFNCRRLLVLPVVLLAGDPAALPVLRTLDPGALPLRHRPVGERLAFHLLHV
ncbi:MAG TPA: hypothetical protein VN494_01315, partial [Patescibacteria group bacterium]|nr:hypothetical protein [Patescibacteria group bacterium]